MYTGTRTQRNARPTTTNEIGKQNQTPAQALTNIACGKIATTTLQHILKNKGAFPPLPPILTPPYEGSRAMLKIDKAWITAHCKGELYKARRTKPMEEYQKTSTTGTTKYSTTSTGH